MRNRQRIRLAKFNCFVILPIEMSRLSSFALPILCLSILEQLAWAGSADATNDFVFRLPSLARYHLEAPAANSTMGTAATDWLRARTAGGGTNVVEFGDRIVLQLQS